MTDNVNDKDLTPWLLNTILITGDPMINGTDEKRYFNGASVKDMFYKLVPLMKKKPAVSILHVDTNDTVSDSSKVIPKKIKSVILYIKVNNLE